MSEVYVYVVDRDFGFAPNPFHGCCTLATCKPVIRRNAKTDDWIVGIGGSRLGATGRCVFAMCVQEALTFDEYWSDRRFYDKRPVRNGSAKMLVGDNIYHMEDGVWVQADSHHSNPDGSPNYDNLRRDTSEDRVLVSWTFYYFGGNAPEIPREILAALGYQNGRGHRRFSSQRALRLLDFISRQGPLGTVLGDPFDFSYAQSRYSGSNSRVIL